MNEKLYQVALELIPRIGDITAKNLIAYCGSASAIFTSKKAQLQKIPGIGQKTIAQLTSASLLKEAEQILSNAEKKGMTIYHYTDSLYPEKLKQVADAPNIIYTKGNTPDFKRAVAIVGTRNATEYGKAITEKIVYESKDLSAVIVSGLAYGIDITAHRAALKNNIPTYGVLAGGLDKLYPSVHKKTADEMLESGGLISENPPGIQAEAHFFPARNRIIAGLCDAVIVVEAAKRGGALITGNIADSYNRAVFAVPGDLSNKYSEGCNYLVRNHKANIYTSVEDLKYHLNWDEPVDTKQEPDLSLLTETEKDIYKILQEHTDGIAIDELAWRCQVPINKLASLLLNLEFSGLVKNIPGKKYRIA